MSILHKAALEEFKKEHFAKYESKIQEAAGAPVAIEVEWNSFADETTDAKLYDQALPRVFFEPLITGFKVIASSDVGKQAIKDGLKKIVIKNAKKIYGKDAFSFAEGVLTIDYLPFVNWNLDDQLRAEAVTEALSNGL